MGRLRGWLEALAETLMVLAVVVLGGLAGWAQGGPVGVPPLPPIQREMRATWTASVSNIDWPLPGNVTESAQKATLTAHLNAMAGLRMNAMFLQVRPECDALYRSNIEPWSGWLTGTQGKSPGYDPLEWAIAEAHKRGIAMHAWLNPYRVSTSLTTSTKAANHISRARPDLTLIYGTNLWMDPGNPECAAITKAVIGDLARRYNLDGIVFDDYFYPYAISGVPFPDWGTYARFGAGRSLGDWRRDNVNRLVRECRDIVHEARAGCAFGIGPFGIYRPGQPTGVVGLDSFESIYTDSRRWLVEGWVDHFSPQLYWNIASTGQPYATLLRWWCAAAQNPLGRITMASNYTSRAGQSGWPASEIVNQVNLNRTTFGAQGNVHFSMKALTNNQSGVATALRNGPYAVPALVPQMPWLEPGAALTDTSTATMAKPPAPVVSANTASGVVGWAPLPGTAGRDAEAAVWAVSTLSGSTWTTALYAPGTRGITVNPATVSWVAVRAVNRANTEGVVRYASTRAGVGGWERY